MYKHVKSEMSFAFYFDRAGKSCSCDLKDAESTIKLNDQCLPPTKIPSKEDVEDSDWAIVDYYSLDKHTVSADGKLFIY